MRKWFFLILILAGWTGVGFCLFDGKPADHRSSPALGKVSTIVATAPNLTEILFALGLEERVAGVTIGSVYPPAAENKPKIGTFWQPNIEAVIALRPELVVTLNFPQQKNLADRLTRVGYNCLTLEIEKVDQFFNAIEKIGKAASCEIQAGEIITDIHQKLDALSKKVSGKEKIKVLWVVQRQPLRVAGTDTFVNELIELAGGVNAIGKTIHKYPPIGTEQVIAIAPDVIIEPAMTTMNINAHKKQAIAFWNKYANIPAVANGRIYVIDGDTVSQLGPRLYQGVETVAKCLRPEIFETTKQ